MTLRTVCPSETMSTLCALFGKSRQAFYKWHPSEFSNATMEEIVIEEVKHIRATAPGIGSSTLYVLLLKVFGKDNMLGRDHFYRLMKERGLQLKKRRTYRTTNSYHRFRKWKNLIKDFTPTAPNQLWVSDITYIKLDNGVVYLHLLTDAYSRKILGWKVADSLEAKHTLDAFNMAAKEAVLNDITFSDIIHHSDRGIQYCCNMYVSRLQSLNMKISMTEEYKPTDNAKAERVNGIIKQLFVEGQRFHEISDVYFAIAKGIAFYNDIRPHSSISHEPPSKVHSGEVINPVQMWKKRTLSKYKQGEMQNIGQKP